MRKIDQLYILRFIVALSVVIFHYGRKAPPFDTYPINVLAGAAPVDFFFVLSGFVLILVYYQPAEKFDPLRFWFNRFARLYPVYLFSLILVVGLSPKLLNDPASVALNLTLSQAWVSPYPASLNYPAWAMSVEVFLYAVFPLCLLAAYKISFKPLAWLVGLFWFGDQVFHMYLMNRIYTGFPSFSHDLLFYNPLVHLNSFLLGFIGGIWFVMDGQKARSFRASLWFGVSVLLCALAWLYFKDIPDLFGLNLKVSIRSGSLSPLYLMLILSLALDAGRLARFFSMAWAVRLGEISYAFYVLQFPVHTFYKRWIETNFPNLSGLGHFAAYLALLLLASYLTFRLIEEPIRSGLRNWYAGLIKKKSPFFLPR